MSSLRLMGTDEGISLGFKAISKPYWESGQSGSDLLRAQVSFPGRGGLGGLVNSQILS